MQLTSARHSIHDAFAIQMTRGGDPFSVGSGTKFDNTRQIFNGVQAGMVISAVMNQQPAYRGAAMYFNGPDDIASTKDIDALKIVLFQRFMKRCAPDPRAAGEIFAIGDRLIQRHKLVVWDHTTEKLSVPRIAATIATSSKARARVVRFGQAFLDLVNEIDNASQVPVWDIINNHRETLREAARKGGHLRVAG